MAFNWSPRFNSYNFSTAVGVTVSDVRDRQRTRLTKGKRIFGSGVPLKNISRGGRNITLRGSVIGSSENDAGTNMANLLDAVGVNEPKQLGLRLERYIMAVPTNVDYRPRKKGALTVYDFNFAFESTESFWSDALAADSTTLTRCVETDQIGNFTLTNGGNAIMYPGLRIGFEGAGGLFTDGYLRISNNTAETSCQLLGFAGSEGTYLAVDTESGRITSEGSVTGAAGPTITNFSGSFPHLVPGNNSMTVQWAFTAEGTTSEIVLTWTQSKKYNSF